MLDSSIRIIYKEYDNDNIIVFFKSLNKNVYFLLGLHNFEAEMEYWDMPTKLVDCNGEKGYLFKKVIDRKDLEKEIERFIKHNGLNKLV